MKNQRLKEFLIAFSNKNRKLHIVTKRKSTKNYIVTILSEFK